MNISSLISLVNTALDKTRVVLQQIPSVFLTCTCSRRPGFSSIVTSAKAYADMRYVSEDNDEIVKEFTYYLINRIKLNIQDDGVCFIIIPPNRLQLQLIGANAGGPAVLMGSNKNFVFAYGIIR